MFRACDRRTVLKQRYRHAKHGILVRRRACRTVRDSALNGDLRFQGLFGGERNVSRERSRNRSGTAMARDQGGEKSRGNLGLITTGVGVAIAIIISVVSVSSVGASRTGRSRGRGR